MRIEGALPSLCLCMICGAAHDQSFIGPGTTLMEDLSNLYGHVGLQECQVSLA